MLLLAVVFVKLNTALAVLKNGEEFLVADGRAVAVKYVRSGAILIDVLTILPTVIQVSTPQASTHTTPVNLNKIAT